MTKKYTPILAFSALCLALSPAAAALAATSAGIDTMAGQTTLPLAVEGIPVMTLEENASSNTVAAGVNTATPQATLDVNGEARVGNSGVACTSANEGALQYNKNTHVMNYCNGTAWNSLGYGAGAFAGYCSFGSDNGGKVFNIWAPFLAVPANTYGTTCTCPSGWTRVALSSSGHTTNYTCFQGTTANQNFSN